MTIKHDTLVGADRSEPDSNSATPSATATKVAIIGAGMTGLMSAQLLEQAFASYGQAIDICIFEKSAGVGRLATRYNQPESHSKQQWQFDFGAQFFTAKSEAFQAYLQPWLERGVIECWHATTAIAHGTESKPDIELTGRWDSEQPRHISSPKMTSFGRALAAELKHTKLHYKTRVAPLSSDNCVNHRSTDTAAQTTLWDDKGNELGRFDWVVCTAPQAQAIELFEQTDFALLDNLKLPKMLACYSLMLGWEQASTLPPSLKEAQWEVLDVQLAHSPLSRVFIEQHKPGRGAVLPSITIHASNDWSESKVDAAIEEVQQQLLQATQHLLGWEHSTAPQWIDCHRWRYAATAQIESNIPSQISYVDSSKQWLVTGDWCDEGRIESCFKAATQVVEVIAP
ncbi:NAD(P)/FAD-dependent oxidoreductase [Psychrobacter phenylpyruvicus]|uniref:Protoporphyrinogen oxidase n=1 Tax=Psychrobacter phenylpyruvicus TaxID=29432 RepID=A0A379LNP1_9GAMM|nr:NAD(P)-binding protein [Psychrobacter phenylpyruvicus]SUD91384.1 protoporphyrinogen oxidase [Psychrobacter phenylpyruvicus]